MYRIRSTVESRACISEKPQWLPVSRINIEKTEKHEPFSLFFLTDSRQKVKIRQGGIQGYLLQNRKSIASCIAMKFCLWNQKYNVLNQASKSFTRDKVIHWPQNIFTILSPHNNQKWRGGSTLSLFRYLYKFILGYLKLSGIEP